MSASITTEWSVTCPSGLASDACYYDCRSSAPCMHSIAPVELEAEGAQGGQWFVVPLPSGYATHSLRALWDGRVERVGLPLSVASPSPSPRYTAFSLLFETGMEECSAAGAPAAMCVELRRNSTCDDDNFAVSRGTRLAIAAPTRGNEKCA